jgi:ABC-type Fe3+-siderophore transport system permease subunit
MPIAATLLCAWLCFLFEDLAVETTAASATPLLFRRALRASIALPSVAVVWFAHTWIGPLTGPSAAMATAFGAAVALSLAAATVAERLADPGRAGLVAGAGVVFVLLVVPVAIGRPPSVDPAQPPVGDPFTYWPAIAIGSCVVLALAHLDRFQRR